MQKEKYSQRAIRICREALEDGRISQWHINSILKYDNVDVSSLEKFFESDDDDVKMGLIDIFSIKGNPNVLIELLQKEQTDFIIEYTLSALLKRVRKFGNRSLDIDNIESISNLLGSENKAIRESTISFFRKLKQERLLMGLLFDEKQELVDRVKKYIEEANE